ncbi:MAG TPA: branched-chain amino acid ABC transporter permease/ATP-binding protein [Acidimicrobiales bacterium]|nr:branched-chain amino acid ABC transporter permease/ATP-binding protein [Acidimicrobiales bacterium]
MSQFWQFVLLGLGTGALYALTAQGLVLIYRGSGVLNFAQGAVGMLGAFVYYRVGAERGWSTAVALTVAIAASAVVSGLIHVLVMMRLRRASPLIRLVATLGVLFLLVAIAQQVWGITATIAHSPLPSGPKHPFSDTITVPEDRFWIIVIAVVITFVLAALYRWTRFGQATEAVAENAQAASALGLSPDVIATANWALGGALAAVAGVLIAPILSLQTAALAFVVLRALTAALVGRFHSFTKTLVAALTIGVVEALLQRFIENKGVFGPVTSDNNLLFGQFSPQSVSRSAAFLIIIAVLVASGRGLPLRSELLDRLPALGTGRVRWPLVGLVSVIGLAALLTLPDDWASAAVLTLAWAVILLSIVVVTGYVGQLSLAQVALAGFGVWIAARLVDAHGWPFPLAALAGVVATIPVGVLIAIPALRTRGMNLAVLTFGLSVCIVELILTNPALTGGLQGTTVGRPSLLGLDVNAFDHPGRWAALCFVVLVVLGLGVANLRRGRSGRRLIAVRDNERAAASLGIGVAGAKIYAFGIGAAIAAIGGILLAFRGSQIAYAEFGGLASVQAVVLTVIGGIGYIAGPVIGGLNAAGGVTAHILDKIGFESTILDLFSGALLIFTLLVNPDGVAHAAATVNRPLIERVSRRRRKAPVVEAAPSDAGPVRADPRRLEVQDLTVRFGGVVAVDSFTFAVDPGEVLGLIGPNGAGKTTVIDAVTGFVSAAKGEVSIADRAIHRLRAPQRARAGVSRSFQSLELFDDLTVAENLLAACEDRSPWVYFEELVRPAKPKLSPAAWAAVREFDLEADLARYPQDLSYGRRRLVAIARTIATAPSVILLDEPAAGLSEAESAELGRLIRRLAKDWGLAVLLIEHDVSLVMETCDRIIVLDFGKKIAEGTPEEIASDSLVVAAYLGEPDAQLDAIAGDVDLPGPAPTGSVV